MLWTFEADCTRGRWSGLVWWYDRGNGSVSWKAEIRKRKWLKLCGKEMKDKIMNCWKIPGRGGCAQQSHSEAGQRGPNLILLYTIFGRKGITFFCIPSVDNGTLFTHLVFNFASVKMYCLWNIKTSTCFWNFFFCSDKIYLLALSGYFSDRNEGFVNSFTYFNKWNSYPVIYPKPEEGKVPLPGGATPYRPL